MTLTEMLNAADAKKKNGNWVPANCGTETPITYRTGRILLYVYQPSTGNHAYLDCQTDIVLTPEEAMSAMGML